MTSVDELFGDTALFGELETAVWQREVSLAAEIERTRLNANTGERPKTYVLPLLGSTPVLDLNDIFVRFALQPQILNIASSYFRMLVKLHGYNVWHNFATKKEPQQSQLWHRDPEDRAILKVFVYITDVDEKAGPLFYVPGTHAQGKIKVAPPFTVIKEGESYVRRADDRQMKEVVAENQWITAIGPKASVVFVDTKGWHKGGWVLENERILYLCVFTSQAASSPEVFQRQHTISSHLSSLTSAIMTLDFLDPFVRFAVGG